MDITRPISHFDHEEHSEDALLVNSHEVDISQGLTWEEAAVIQKRDGKNVITLEKPPTWYGTLFGAVVHPFNFVLSALAIVAISTLDYRTFTVMMLMVVLSVVLRFWQEMKASAEAESLKKLVHNKATVIRRKPIPSSADDACISAFDLESQAYEIPLTHRQISVAEDILMEDIVVGDVIKLAAGDMIPGDVRLLKAKDLFISQSALTGEAMPVEKLSTDEAQKQQSSSRSLPGERDHDQHDEVSDLPDQHETVAATPPWWQRLLACIRREKSRVPSANGLRKAADQKRRKNHLEQQDLCFMGTSVVSGTGLAVVQATGIRTLFGEMASQLSKKRPVNAFQIGVRAVSILLIRFMAVMVPIVFVVNGALTKDWLQALLFSVAIAVGLTPEMLPMIVNANLARGAYVMSKKKSIVKRMESIMNFGAMDILCTDKTGTLTQDKVVLLKHMNLQGTEYPRVVEFAYLNSFFQTGLRNLLDLAIIHYMEQGNESPLWRDVRLPAPEKPLPEGSLFIPPPSPAFENQGTSGANFETLEQAADAYRRAFTKIDEIPFDFVRRRMSVVLEKTTSGEKMLICKGAVEEVMSICDSVEDPATFLPVPFPAEIYASIKALGHRLNREGLRVIAVAYKLLDDSIVPGSFNPSDEKGLIFLGFTAFLDPPKESTAPAIKELMANGVVIKVLTGDSDEVCKTICEQVGLPVTGVITGKELEERIGSKAPQDPLASPSASVADLSLTTEPDPKKEREKILDEIASKCTVFAKLAPLQKAEVVASLRRQGHVVGFLGDGINDAAALREADVGISVDSAVDVAKENADIILLEKSLMVLVKGVRQGRLTYGNTIKYIKMTASSNFGNVFSVLIASAWLPFLPMLPMHLVTQNLLYDFTQVIIPWDNMDADFLLTPRNWSANDVGKFMAIVGPISSLFDVCTFLTMWYYFDCKTPEQQTLFQTAWFVEGLLTQTLIIHMIRTDKIPFFQSRASWTLISATTIVMALGIGIPFSPLNTFLNMVPLPPMYFAFLFSFLLSYCVLTQVVKKIYIRIFNTWL